MLKITVTHKRGFEWPFLIMQSGCYKEEFELSQDREIKNQLVTYFCFKDLVRMNSLLTDIIESYHE